MPYFLPRQDGALLTWAQNISSRITSEAGHYNVPTARYTAFAALVSAYAAAFAANERGVRSKATASAKSDAKLALTKAAQELSRLLQSDPTITDSEKYELGINVRATPALRPVPVSAPGIDVLDVRKNTVSCRAHGAAAGRGLPADIAGVVVFSHVGATPPTDYRAWYWEGSTSKAKFDVTWDAALPMGTKVWICAAFCNERNQAGPVCDPIPLTLLGTGALPATADTGERTLAA